MRHHLLFIVAGLFCAAMISRADAQRLNVEALAIYEGKPVASVTYTGNSITRPYVIERELRTRVGAPFDILVLNGDLIRLENLAIFSSVQVDVTENGDGVDVALTVKEMPWIVPYPAVSFTEQDGLSLGAGIASLNFLGRDIGLAGSFLVGGINTFQLSVGYPWITGNHVSFTGWAAHLERFDELNEFQEKSNEISPWFGTYLGKHGRLRGMVGWFNMNSDSTGRTIDPDNSDDFLRTAVGVGYDNRNSWRNPARGTWSNLEAMYSHEWNIGRGFWTGTVDLRQFVSAGWHSTFMGGLLVNGQTGEVGVDVPIYMTYRMGGANSIRGYDIDKLGRVLYGKNQFILTLEEQFLLIDIKEYSFFKWSASIGLQVAFFMDFGTAWTTPEEFNIDRFKIGGGAGIRWLVPGVDMVRFDLGFGEGGSIRLHLATQNKLQAQRWRIR